MYADYKILPLSGTVETPDSHKKQVALILCIATPCQRRGQVAILLAWTTSCHACILFVQGVSGTFGAFVFSFLSFRVPIMTDRSGVEEYLTKPSKFRMYFYGS